MNRRELFRAVTGATALAGVTAKAIAYDEPKTHPALIVLEVERVTSNEQSHRMLQYLGEALKETPFEGVKAIVLTEGIKMTILDADGRVLNRTIADA